jgi:fermentation-respiration switch protein FrsA (DUF1100 family)
MVRSAIASIALVLLGIYLGAAAVLYVFQRDYLYFPDKQRPAADLAGVASLREFELVTSDGLRLLAWYLPPARGRPVVLYFHGNAGSIANRVPRLADFADAGLGVLMPEYRGYGGNEGVPTETGLYADAAAAMDFLDKEAIAPNRIVVYGESLGTGVATRVASEHGVAAVVLEAPYTSIAAIAARHYSFVPVGLMLKDRFDSLSRIAQLRAPILILQGERDQVVPPELGRELFAAAPEPKQFWVAPGAGHEDLYDHGAANIVLAFLRRHVRAAN